MNTIKVCYACSHEAPQHEIDCPIRIALDLGLDCVPQEELDRLEKFYQEVKKPIKHQIVFVHHTGHNPIPDSLMGNLQRKLGEQVHMVLVKDRPEGGTLSFDIEANGILGLELERVPVPAPLEIVDGHGRFKAKEFLNLRDWVLPPPRKVNRADTGKHGPYNNFNGKNSGKHRSKGRKR